MSEWGHFYLQRGGGFFVDHWGAGPFTITDGQKTWRFEDSERFGPVPVNKDGDPNGRFFGERNRFWKVYYEWVRLGRRVSKDGECILEPLDLDALGLRP